MRVAFDARVLDLPGIAETGIGRYVRCLLEALKAEGRDVAELRGLRRPPAPERVREAWEHLLLARDVRRSRAEVLHSPAIDLTSLRPGAPLVVTLHDLAPLKRPERYLRSGLKHRLRYAAVRRAARVVVPSRAVAEDARRLLGIPDERLAVVPEAAAPCFAPVSDARARLARLDVPDRFLLWVGALDPPDPRKGVEALVREVAGGAGPPLVLAGRAGQEARGLERRDRVFLTGRVSDFELAALYTAADALVLSSEDEGFGLPAVEALACGTPVAAFSAGGLPETLNGARGARLVPPGDHARLLAAAEELSGTSGEPPARSWADVARESWAVYEAAAQGRSLR